MKRKEFSLNRMKLMMSVLTTCRVRRTRCVYTYFDFN